MAATPFVNIENNDAGGDIRGKLNLVGSDTEISFRVASAFAEIENEINYFDTATIVFAKAEAKWYTYNGTIWIEENDIPAIDDLLNYLLLAGGTMTGDITFSGSGIDSIDTIQFNTAFSDGVSEGRLQWNDDDKTLNLGLAGGDVNLQVGQEHVSRVKNDQGAQIDNGSVVYVSGGIGSNALVKLANAGSIATAFAVGVATENIAIGQFGYITLIGLVRDVNTLGYAPGTILWLSDADDGEYTNVKPTAPSFSVGIAVVVRESATVGVIQTKIVVIPRVDSLTDVHLDSISNDEVLVWDSGDSRWENKVVTSSVPVVLSTYDAEPARASVSNIHGGLNSLAIGQPLDTVPTDIVVSKGIGKIIVVVNAGSDTGGSIVVTGTSVNRETGALTPGDTDEITVDALTTDATATDGNGNNVYSFTGAYPTSKWFVGSVTLSTISLTLTDVDVYHCSFEQFNDTPGMTLETFDVNLLVTNTLAEFDAYLYLFEVSGGKVNLTSKAGLNLGTDGVTAVADQYYRLRVGNIDYAFDGSTDGIFVEAHYSNSPSYIEDMNMKVWAVKSGSPTFT